MDPNFDEDVPMENPPLEPSAAHPHNWVGTSMDNSMSRTQEPADSSSRGESSCKKQAVPGVSRHQLEEANASRDDAQRRAQDERRQRKQAQEELKNANTMISALQDRVFSLENNIEAVVQEKMAALVDPAVVEQFLMAQVTTTLEKNIAGYYAGELDKKLQEFSDLQKAANDAVVEAHQRRDEEHQIAMDLLRTENEELEEQARAREKQAQKREAAMEKIQIAHENQIAALLSRQKGSPGLRGPEDDAPSEGAHAESHFLQKAPPMRAKLVSPRLRMQREAENMVRRDRDRIPTLVTPPDNGEDDEMPSDHGDCDPESTSFDIDDPIVVDRLRALIREVLNEMGIKKAGSKTSRRAATNIDAVRRLAQEKLVGDQDLEYKKLTRETFRIVTALNNAQDFYAYTPAPVEEVLACSSGEIDVDDKEFRLDFSRGFGTSRWNRLVLTNMCNLLLRLRARHPIKLGVPDVSMEYVYALFHGLLTRAQKSWKAYQPRRDLMTGDMEKLEDAIERAESAQATHQASTLDYSRKKTKYDRRVRIVKKVLSIKSMGNGAQDHALWQFLLDLLQKLKTGGMSSEEDVADEDEGHQYIAIVHRVKICPWRATHVTKYLDLIDNAGIKMATKPTGLRKRVRGERNPISKTLPPRKLPEAVFDQEWLESKRKNQPRVYDELEISQDAFKLLELALAHV